jgi:hypothetical protein
MPKKGAKLRKSDDKKGIAKAGGNRKRPTEGGPAKLPSGHVKTVGELGINAASLGIKKNKAKTHKGRKILEAKEAQIIEGDKKSIIMRGKKVSQPVLDLMKDLHLQRGTDLSKLFLRTGKDIHPFDDIGPVEMMAHKQNCALFVAGTHQKKRPDNIMFGSMFADHLLDLFEFGVSDYQPMTAFKTKDING